MSSSLSDMVRELKLENPDVGVKKMVALVKVHRARACPAARAPSPKHSCAGHK